MPQFRVRSHCSLDISGTIYNPTDTVTLSLAVAELYRHQLESAGDATVPADFFKYTPAKIIDYVDAAGGGGGGTGLNAAQTTAAMKSALETATSVDQLEALLRDIDPSGSDKFRDSDAGKTPFRLVWEVDKETDAYTQTTLTLAGAPYTPTGAPNTWEPYEQASSTTPSPTTIATTETLVTTAGAQTITAGAKAFSIVARTGSFTRNGVTYTAGQGVSKYFLPGGSTYPAQNYTVSASSEILVEDYR